MNQPNDPLDPLLDRWGEPPEQPSLAPEVWRRVATASAPRPRATTCIRWWQVLDLTFGRTSFAAAFVVACVLLGLFLAELRVSHLRSERDHQLALTYLRLIDPLLAEVKPTSPPEPRS